MECCVANITDHCSKKVIVKPTPISVGYMWQSTGEDVGEGTSGDHSQIDEVLFITNFKYYFGLDCIKRFARDILEIETENNSKYNIRMIFN